MTAFKCVYPPPKLSPRPLHQCKESKGAVVQPGSASGLTNVRSAPPHHHLIPSGPSNGSEGRGMMQFVRKGANAAITMST